MPGFVGALRAALLPIPEQMDPVPVRPEFPCGVRDCYEPQIEVARDDRDITVSCPVHNCNTMWPLVKPEAKEQHIIRVQDGWHQHGTKGRQK